jgi:CheY-like chemotaxis protein
VSAPEASVVPQEVRGGSETILLVEDEVALRHSAALCLRKLGYAVLEAANGPEALEQWDKHKSEIALLLTDQVMPAGMTGCELAARLRRKAPELKVILSTGYSEELGRWSDSEKQGFALLIKPYAVASVAQLVRSCLDGNLQPGETT